MFLHCDVCVISQLLLGKISRKIGNGKDFIRDHKLKTLLTNIYQNKPLQIHRFDLHKTICELLFLTANEYLIGRNQ